MERRQFCQPRRDQGQRFVRRTERQPKNETEQLLLRLIDRECRAILTYPESVYFIHLFPPKVHLRLSLSFDPIVQVVQPSTLDNQAIVLGEYAVVLVVGYPRDSQIVAVLFNLP